MIYICTMFATGVKEIKKNMVAFIEVKVAGRYMEDVNPLPKKGTKTLFHVTYLGITASQKQPTQLYVQSKEESLSNYMTFGMISRTP